MSENEAKILLCQMYLPQFDEKEKQALTMAIQALEEIQEYRAIGTVEELQELKENHIRCEDCAGCTSWKCDCANVRDYTIREFAERLRLNTSEFEIMNGFGEIEDRVDAITISKIDEVALEMRGEEWQ